MVRGQNYTFIVEGGDDPEQPSNYHPFYITSSISGGRLRNTVEQQEVRDLEGRREGERGRERNLLIHTDVQNTSISDK